MFIRRFIFSIIYLLIILYGIIVLNSELYFLLVPIIPYLFYFSKLIKLEIPISFEITILIFVIFSMLLGSMFNFYIIIPFWDILLHTFSGFILATIPIFYIKKYNIVIPTFIKLVFIFLISMGFASIWEMIEFGLDMLLGIDSQKNLTEGVIDTMVDICVHSIGTIIFLIYYSINNTKYNRQ